MGALGKKYLVKRMEEVRIKNRLVVTPLLNIDESIDYCSIDVRLSNQFIVMNRHSFPYLDIGNQNELDIDKFQERLVINFGKNFILHPRQLVLSSTFEYVQIPNDLMCYVIGKSTWGRLGLVIATATKVDPGFKGCITLEMINEGDVPIYLYPGIPIAQLVFHKVNLPDKSGYEGSYSHAIGPEFPNISKSKKEWDYWTKYYKDNI